MQIQFLQPYHDCYQCWPFRYSTCDTRLTHNINYIRWQRRFICSLCMCCNYYSIIRCKWCGGYYKSTKFTRFGTKLCWCTVFSYQFYWYIKWIYFVDGCCQFHYKYCKIHLKWLQHFKNDFFSIYYTFPLYFQTDDNPMGGWNIVLIVGGVIYIVPALLFMLFGSGDVQRWNEISEASDTTVIDTERASDSQTEPN